MGIYGLLGIYHTQFAAVQHMIQSQDAVIQMSSGAEFGKSQLLGL